MSRLLIPVVLAGMLLGASAPGFVPQSVELPAKGTIKKDVDYFAPGTSSTKPTGKFHRGDAVEIIREFTHGSTNFLRVVAQDGRDGFVLANAVETSNEDQSKATKGNVTSRPLLMPSDAALVNNLGIRLIQSTLEPGQNLVISPYGIWSNLRIVQQGLSRSAGQKLGRLIGTSESKRRPQSVTSGLESSDILLHRSEVMFSEKFEGFLSSAGVPRTETTFDDASRMQLNDWIADRSHGKIVDYFSEQTWNADAEVLICNVAWLEQAWAAPFMKDMTEESAFYITESDVIQVPMMAQTNTLELLTSDELQCDVGILPYEHEDLAAVLIVPHRKDGLPELLKRIDGRTFNELTAAAKAQKTLVRLPKFNISSGLDVLTAVKSLGTELSAFELTEVTSTRPVNVSSVVQNSKIDVDEEGTSAVSVTTAEFSASLIDSGDETVKELLADRPFLFAIQHRPSQNILFLAAVTNPESVTLTKEHRED